MKTEKASFEYILSSGIWVYFWLHKTAFK